MSEAVFEAPALAAVIVAAALVVTGREVIGKVATEVPAATVKLAGTVAREVTELVNARRVPPAGAGRFNVTVPVAPKPPITLVWLNDRDPNKVWTVKVAVGDAPALEAVIVTVALAVTAEVVIAKTAVVAAAATVTLAGTLAAALLLESVTNVPPDGAAAFKVTVPVELAMPPTTVAGLTETDASLGLTVSVAVLLTLA